MKRLLPLMLLFCTANCLASYLTIRTDGTTFYADPQCSCIAETGITAGNTFYVVDDDQPAADVVKFEFGDETVYARKADVELYSDEEFAFAGPEDDNGNHEISSGSWKTPAWVKWLIFFVIAWALYKFAYKRYFSPNLESVVPEESAPVVENAVGKYGEGSDGYTAAFCGNLDFKPKLKELNRLAALNPGKNTTDAESLRKYLIELQPALRKFLREASGERQFTSDPRFRDHGKLNSAGEGAHEWLYIQLRGKEYADPQRLLELNPLKFEVYVSENLSRNLRSDSDRQLLEQRLKESLAHIDDYDRADCERIYLMLWSLKRHSDPQEAYDYICKAVELGHNPYPKEMMEKKYGTDGNGNLAMGAYKRKRAIKWAAVAVAGLATVAALMLLALYVALAALFALCLFMTFKLMINDATDRHRPSPSKTAIQQAASAHTCGCCKKFNNPDCPRWSQGVSTTEPCCGMIEE